MRLVFGLLAISLTILAQMKTASSSNPAQRITQAERILVVTTADWNAVDGTMRRFERHSGHWAKIGDPVPIVVGKSGLGWDPELKKSSGPAKHEGDGRSPAGVFDIGVAFGFDAKGPTGREYIPLTSATECVDDVKSAHYAHIVDRNGVPKIDWDSSEKMREIDVYKLGMVVNYNLADTVAGHGSCIFLHIWRGAGRGTAGCTAMDEAQLQELVKWIGTSKAVLVQTPTAEYQKLRSEWGLP